MEMQQKLVSLSFWVTKKKEMNEQKNDHKIIIMCTRERKKIKNNNSGRKWRVGTQRLYVFMKLKNETVGQTLYFRLIKKTGRLFILVGLRVFLVF